MEDRFRRRLRRLGIPVLGTAVVVALLVFCAEIRVAFRMLGLWAYLATVNRRWPERKLVQDARRASSDIDVPVPFWGSSRWLNEESIEHELAPKGGRV